MRRTMVLWEAYVTRFEVALERYRLHRLSADEAGEVLGMSGRQFRRLCVRYEEAGVDGLRDRRLGRVSGRRAPASELERMRRLYVEEYADFTVKHFHEALARGAGGAARVSAGLHGDAAVAAGGGPGGRPGVARECTARSVRGVRCLE